MPDVEFHKRFNLKEYTEWWKVDPSIHVIELSTTRYDSQTGEHEQRQRFSTADSQFQRIQLLAKGSEDLCGDVEKDQLDATLSSQLLLRISICT